MEDNKLCLEKQPLSDELLNKMNAYWRAANYLSAGQLYLLDLIHGQWLFQKRIIKKV